MKKIVTLFKRAKTGLVYDEVSRGAEWVLRGEGIASRKWDGVAVLFRKPFLYKRCVIGKGEQAPFSFEATGEEDPHTGEQAGWVLVGNDAEDQMYYKAWRSMELRDLIDGMTYELCGPGIEGNPEKLSSHVLFRHGWDEYINVPRTFMGLRQWLGGRDMEGLVWRHPNGKMAKIKKVDFGLTRDESW